jgi:nondiscriminating glutamyl-tRNA synthetase
MNKPRVRFAPSPTGELHVGNARTALFNWLYARSSGGTFVLRIEDTDRERTSVEFEKGIIEDLNWLGIDWDEGPEKDGGFGPYNQFERLPIYESFLDKLISSGSVYKCYCTEEELALERQSLLSRGLMPRYMGKCRGYTEEQCRELEESGLKPSYRFRVGEGQIEFDDVIRGPMKFNCEAVGDFIIVRSSGIPAYNFAVVIDDHLMEISHVIRGEDHLSNTAVQIMVYRALGFEPPRFAHHSLILGKDRAKLSKRQGSVSVKDFRAKGILPEAMINYLALLGSSFAEAKEILSKDEMVSGFSIDRAGKSGAIFDEGKLEWVNEHYIRHYSPEALLDLAKPFLEADGYGIESIENQWLVSALASVQGDMKKLSDAGKVIEIFFDERFELSDEARRVLESGRARDVVTALRLGIMLDDGGEGMYSRVSRSIRERTGLKGKDLFMPVRAAITGRTKGPELDKIFSILGRDSLLKRVEKAYRLLRP